MIRRLIILLLIVGCGTEPEDCAGVAGGAAGLDSCAVCIGGTTNLTACVQDCADLWGGTAVEDDCGVCNGIDGYVAGSCYDCVGVANGTAVEDCLGNCGGEANIDECGVCGGEGAIYECGCSDIPNGDCDCDGNVLDECGVCGGDGSTCIVCADCSDSECCDCDGNVYETVQIGEQLWMAENLKVTHYNNGDEIPIGTMWPKPGGGGCYGVYPTYDDETSQSTCGDDCADVYGNLFNGYAVDDERGICPEGFHVPSDEEFIELEMFLGMSEEEANSYGWRGTGEGSKLAGSSDLWNDGVLENNSEFGTGGFNGLPAGYLGGIKLGCASIGACGSFWSSSEGNSSSVWGPTAWLRRLSYEYSNVDRYSASKNHGFSVRCLKD